MAGMIVDEIRLRIKENRIRALIKELHECQEGRVYKKRFTDHVEDFMYGIYTWLGFLRDVAIIVAVFKYTGGFDGMS